MSSIYYFVSVTTDTVVTDTTTVCYHAQKLKKLTQQIFPLLTRRRSMTGAPVTDSASHISYCLHLFNVTHDESKTEHNPRQCATWNR